MFFSLTNVKVVWGLELTRSAHDSWICEMCKLETIKNEVEIKQKSQSSGTLKDVFIGIERGSAISIAISGKNILHRKLDGFLSPDESQDKLRRIFPDVNLEEFYIQSVKQSNTTFFSLVRKKIIDKIVTESIVSGLFIINISLGPFILKPFINHLKPMTPRILLPSEDAIIVEREEIKSIEPHKEQCNIEIFYLDDVCVEPNFLVAYSSGLAAILNQYAHIIDVNALGNVKKEFFYKRLYDRIKVVVPLIIFILIVMGYLFKTKLGDNRNELLAKLQSSEETFQKQEELHSKLNQRRGIAEELGWARRSKFAFYADGIGASVPASVKLTRLTLSPMDADDPNYKFKFKKNRIKIEGTSPGPQAFNDWLILLSRYSWIDYVGEQSYKYDYSAGTGNFDFVIYVKNEF